MKSWMLACGMLFMPYLWALQPDPRLTIELVPEESVERRPLTDVVDIRVILKRSQAALLVSPVPTVGAVADILEGMDGRGAFSDIKYGRVPPPGFPAFEHLRRLNTLALAFHAAEFADDRSRLLAAVEKGLRHWIDVSPDTSHFWFMEIGVPMRMAGLLVLLGDRLNAEVTGPMHELTRVAYRDGDYYYGARPATGANLMWIARAILESALVEGNVPLAKQAARRLADEIRVTWDEGIQVDLSFYQHGKQLYNGGYGSAFGGDAATMLALLYGTRFAFPETTERLVVDYLLEGQRWMLRNGIFAWGPRGREITRPEGPLRGGYIARLAEIEGLHRRVELAEAVRQIRGETTSTEESLRGNRHFWRSDFMVHHEPAYFASVRMASKRVFATEGGNLENLRGIHLGDGVFQLMKNATEYRNIAPLLDWRKLPGTTIVQAERPLRSFDWWGDHTRGATSFVGGLSDGRVGFAAMECHADEAGVLKAWSFLPNRIHAAGTALWRADASVGPVVTTIEQSFRSGPVHLVYGDEVRSAREGETLLHGPVWVHHRDTAYFLPEGTQGRLLLEHRSTSWSVVTQNREFADREAAGDVFVLWIEHGTEDTGYAYSILPDVSLEAITDSETPLHPLTDETAIVWADTEAGWLQGVFRQPGEHALEGFPAFSVDRPALVQLRRLGAGEWALTVADPTQLAASVGLSMEGRFSLLSGSAGMDWDADGTRLEVSLPPGAQAGRSVTILIAAIHTPNAQGVIPTASVGERFAWSPMQAASDGSAEAHSLPETDARPAMVGLPGGNFRMGTADADTDEWPVRSVCVDAFSLSKTTVTYAQWRRVWDWAVENGYGFEGAGEDAGRGEAGFPVTRANWFDAVKWCNALSELKGLAPVYYTDMARTNVFRSGRVQIAPAMVDWAAAGYRLPTEAEWEYAARAGTDTRFFWGDDPADAGRFANLPDRSAQKAFPGWLVFPTDDGFARIAPVAALEPNPWGLHDMIGNVSEWTFDYYGGYPVHEETNPAGPVNGYDRVRRGGSWMYSTLQAGRVSYRVPEDPGTGHGNVGFRVAQTRW